jgi:hypothetical protein
MLSRRLDKRTAVSRDRAEQGVALRAPLRSLLSIASHASVVRGGGVPAGAGDIDAERLPKRARGDV